ncbi:MAG: DUF3334 family protein [Deltaproteobacteria bacterium]|nr:DUF3334 family protein [Deltaproteobacteria bacterium]
MGYGSSHTTNDLARIFAQACEEIINQATNSEVKAARTMQKVPSVFLKPDIGCFVQFTGDYSGLFIMNFSGPVAIELYRKSMLFMGMPEEELATEYTSDEVVDSLGELINQIIGKARSMIKERYGLAASNPQPKAITISSVITMSIATPLNRPQCRRISFRSAENHSFHIELSLEETEFIKLHPNEKSAPATEATASGHSSDVDDLINSL